MEPIAPDNQPQSNAEPTSTPVPQADTTVSPVNTSDTTNEPSATPVQPSSPAEPAATGYTPQIISPTTTGSAVNPIEPTAPIESSPVSGPVVTSPATNDTPSPATSTVVATAGGMSVASGPHKRRWLLPVIVGAILLLILGGGYVLAVYLPNRPASVYATSLKNSGKAVDVLLADSQHPQVNANSYNVTGSVQVASSSGSFDASLNGAFGKNTDSNLAIQADVMGQKLSVNERSLHVAGSSNPDVYVQVSGIKQYLQSYGLSSLANLDGQWIGIDHTVLNTYLSNLSQSGSTGTSASSPTAAQVNDALTKVQAVNKQYLFTNGGDKAVLTGEKYLGKETKDGRPTYHYSVGYNKTNLQAYLKATGAALDSSSLNTWSKQAYGKSLSDVLQLSKLEQQTASLNGSYRFDMWADTQTKLIERLQFTDPSDGSSLYVAQTYTGGDSYPFILGTNAKDGTGSLKLNVNRKSGVVTATLNAADTSDGTKVNGSFTLNPSTSSVNVTAPAGSVPITQVLSQLGLGGLQTTDNTQDLSSVANLLRFQ